MGNSSQPCPASVRSWLKSWKYFSALWTYVKLCFLHHQQNVSYKWGIFFFSSPKRSITWSSVCRVSMYAMGRWHHKGSLLADAFNCRLSTMCTLKWGEFMKTSFVGTDMEDCSAHGAGLRWVFLLSSFAIRVCHICHCHGENGYIFLPFCRPVFAFWSRQDTVSLRWVKSGNNFHGFAQSQNDRKKRYKNADEHNCQWKQRHLMVLDSGRYQISLLHQPVEADFCNQETKQQPQRYRRNRQTPRKINCFTFSCCTHFQAGSPRRFRSTEKSRRWVQPESRWSSWSFVRAFFWRFLRYRWGCCLVSWLQKSASTGWWSREIWYRPESRTIRCLCFHWQLCSSAFLYRFLRSFWLCANPWKLFPGFHPSKRHGILTAPKRKNRADAREIKIRGSPFLNSMGTNGKMLSFHVCPKEKKWENSP